MPANAKKQAKPKGAAANKKKRCAAPGAPGGDDPTPTTTTLIDDNNRRKRLKRRDSKDQAERAIEQKCVEFDPAVVKAARNIDGPCRPRNTNGT